MPSPQRGCEASRVGTPSERVEGLGETELHVAPRGLAAGKVELKRRATGEKQELSLDSALARLAGKS